jgi:hypothetical protein
MRLIKCEYCGGSWATASRQYGYRFKACCKRKEEELAAEAEAAWEADHEK